MPPPPKKVDRDKETSEERAKRTALRRGLTGLANDTKYFEFARGITALVKSQVFGTRPRFRFKTLDGQVTRWDEDYPHHLPPTLIDVVWLDLESTRETQDRRLPPRTTVIDHGADIIQLLKRVGLDFETGKKHIRIFGYTPKDMELFDA